MIAQSTPTDWILAAIIIGGILLGLGMVLTYFRWYYTNEEERKKAVREKRGY